MDEKITNELFKLNQKISSLSGFITGANQRIGAYKIELVALDNELKELNKFLSVVREDYIAYKEVLTKKKQIVCNTEKIKNLECAKEYSKGMMSKLNGIRTKSTETAFNACEIAIKTKIADVTLKHSSIQSQIAAEQALVGNWEGAIKNVKKSIKTIKENI